MESTKISDIKLINNLNIFAHTHPFIFAFTIMGFSAIFIFFSIKSILPPPALVTRHSFEIIEKNINDKTMEFPNDGWGNKISIKKLSKTAYLLTSYGKDEKPDTKDDLHHKFDI